ncbi:MAG: hypothetical protein ACK4FL_04105 [Microgenomates group bacterium]
MKKMNWIDFQNKILEFDLKIFSPGDLLKIFNVSPRSISGFINYYLKKGQILKLRKNFYCLKVNKPQDFSIANAIYKPSYISLETALSYYSIIPETIYTITSITSRKTKTFTCLEKEFFYHKVKIDFFTGYSFQKVNNEGFYIATPEKALVDFLYFCFLKRKKSPERMNLKNIKIREIFQYTKLTRSIDFEKFVKNFLNYARF